MMRDLHRPRLAARHLLATSASALLLLIAGAAAGAPGIHPQETLATPYPSPLPNTGAQAIAFVNGNPLGVRQRIPGTTNESANVPLCISTDERRVGHAYAIKGTSGADAGKWVPHCYVETWAQKGARIVKPTTAQAPNVKWAPMRKGQALPRLLVPVAYAGMQRIPVYACKESTSASDANEEVGTLQADGSCRLSRTLTSDARTVDASQVLVNSPTGNGNPAYGWITTGAGFIPPGGTLLEWPNRGGVYCSAEGVHGVLDLNDASSDAPGTVKGCRVPVAIPNQGMGTKTVATNIRVFRNDAQSEVAFQADVFVGGSSTRPEVNTGARTRPCFAGAPGFLVEANVTGGFLCRTFGGDRPGFQLLRRKGTIPGEGDRA